ncbi:MAG: branched-chain amino acid ABC transporter substrate-binding protein [Chloroflexi bacterium]|nr:branched-chain amino acid ABC transporter substrate-binding protein [Chloroflexota bacterium]MQC27323.1 branched-chain amino acid ABC transporter substrate-binding protein [Chloroflexota bacterium]
MSKRLFTLLALLMVASLVLAACGSATPTEAPVADEPVADEPVALECSDAIGCVEVAPGDSIHLAYMLTVSGATAFLGEDSLGGIEIALSDRGQVLGHDVELTGEDSGCSSEGGQTAATAVTSDPSVVAIIGTNCSGAATAALPTISGAGLIMCSPSNTAPALTDPDGTWLPGYFRAAHNDKFQGRVAAEFVYNELGAHTAATIHDGSPYADQLQQVFATTFAELGGTVTFQGAVNVGDTDMRTILTTVAADSPDVLYFPIFEPEGNFIVAQSTEIAGLEGTTLVGADGLLSASFPGNSGENVVGVYLSGPYITGDAYDSFLTRWDEQIGGVPPSGFHAFAYDCTNMMLDAIEASAQQGADGTILIGRQALRDAMATTSGFAGLTGNLSCSEYGDCATGEALGVFEITHAELDGNWPPPVIYTP